jgi:hypothetical protein
MKRRHGELRRQIDHFRDLRRLTTLPRYGKTARYSSLKPVIQSLSLPLKAAISVEQSTEMPSDGALFR